MIVSEMTRETAVQAALLEKELFSHPWGKADFLHSLEDESRLFLVCLEEDRLMGYCGLMLAGEDGDVLTVGVAPANRRKGVGQLLMKALIRAAARKGGKHLFLEVRESNQPARGLYEKLGFRQVGKRPRYYQDPQEDGLIYTLEVKE